MDTEGMKSCVEHGGTREGAAAAGSPRLRLRLDARELASLYSDQLVNPPGALVASGRIIPLGAIAIERHFRMTVEYCHGPCRFRRTEP